MIGRRAQVLREAAGPGRRPRDHGVPGLCGELPKITLPQSSMIKPLSEDGTTALSTVWTSDDATESVVRDVAAMRERSGPTGPT